MLNRFNGFLAPFVYFICNDDQALGKQICHTNMQASHYSLSHFVTHKCVTIYWFLYIIIITKSSSHMHVVTTMSKVRLKSKKGDFFSFEHFWNNENGITRWLSSSWNNFQAVGTNMCENKVKNVKKRKA